MFVNFVYNCFSCLYFLFDIFLDRLDIETKTHNFGKINIYF